MKTFVDLIIEITTRILHVINGPVHYFINKYFVLLEPIQFGKGYNQLCRGMDIYRIGFIAIVF